MVRVEVQPARSGWCSGFPFFTVSVHRGKEFFLLFFLPLSFLLRADGRGKVDEQMELATELFPSLLPPPPQSEEEAVLPLLLSLFFLYSHVHGGGR